MLPDICFSSVRPHHGTRHGGFEELAVSLFRYECGDPFEITRVNGAGGDGGVEAYTEASSGEIIGLQTKFFDKLGVSQFRQIEDSIKTARQNHSTLVTYIVATPLDLTPAQGKRWKLLKSAAKRRKPSLNLTWWGESELIELLTRPEHAGRLTYWFGAGVFERDWLKTHNDRARADLDTRYTPESHVRVQAQKQMDAFAKAPELIKEYYEKARRVWITVRSSLVTHEAEKSSEKLAEVTSAARNAASRDLLQLGDGDALPNWTEAAAALGRLEDSNLAISEALEEAGRSDQDANQAANPRHSNLAYWKNDMEKAYRQIRTMIDFVDDHTCTTQRFLLVKGQAGAGKSHLLAKFIEELETRGQVSLFVLGEYFTSAAEPWSQLTARVGWHDGPDALLAALNHAAEVSGQPALLVIDALNESTQRKVWMSHLASFAERIAKWPWVRLVVSCRNDFLRLTIPNRILNGDEAGWAEIEHHGFGAATFDAVARYFDAYDVRARDYPPLLPEFGNPLFLKTFAEAFAGVEIPSGPLSLDRVMQRRIQVACDHIRKLIDCPPDSTRDALAWLADEIEKSQWQPIPLGIARRGIDAFFSSTGESRSLYHHLKSSGLVTEVGSYDYESEPEVKVRFAYERFSDYFIAKRVLKGITSVQEFRAEWKSRGYESWNTLIAYHRNQGLMRALAILLPEHLGLELVDLLEGEQVRRLCIADFLLSLPWRSAASINARSYEILQESQKTNSLNDVITTLLRLSSIPAHPWSAGYLHARLKPMPVAERDQVWTVPVSRMLGYSESVPEFFLQWLFQSATERISDEQAHLIGTVLAWFFSSNDRGFRQRATFAAIKLLIGKPEVVARLVRDFHDVNDPYVVERVFAVAAGVAAREHEASKLSTLAAAVWETVFAPPLVLVHIHTRHYAHLVMAKAAQQGVLPPDVAPKDFKPPYRSNWPHIWNEEESRAWGKADEGWGVIIRSIEPEYGNGMCNYGDFGRYVMQAHVHQWSNVRIEDSYPQDDKRLVFDENLARRWVLQRIIELGWTPAKFSDYEKQLSHGRQRVDIEARKQERIGKKYQWIALRELEALLSDHFHLARRWRGTSAVFEGAWQLYAPDFDPTEPIEDPALEYAGENVYEERIGRNAKPLDPWINYPDPFRDKRLTRARSAWVRHIPDDPGQLLRVPNAAGWGADALVLGLWQAWDEPDSFPPREPGDGVPHMYVHARAWVVPRKQQTKWLRFLRETHFWGDGLRVPELGASDLGEFPWAKRFEGFRRECQSQDRFGREFPPGLGHASCWYNGKASVPSPQIIEMLKAKWSGRDFDFVDGGGAVVSTAPKSQGGCDLLPCLVRRDKLLQALREHEMTLIWGVCGERHCFDHDATHGHVADAHVMFSGVYHLDDRDEIKGGLTMRHVIDIVKDDHSHKGAYPQRMELLPFGTKLPTLRR
jgi:hypothetical protein